ncbi:MAG: enoyl-CoA hydratase/isomerase family protein [Acidobacteriota bacterium]|nr:enoyl-CoA hydratase/isomerase family protein [Acidobacteriota bacterium]
MAYDYELIHTRLDEGALFATIDNPPINLFSVELYDEMAAFTKQVEDDSGVRVLVLQSANADFFIAHFDVEAILAFPTDGMAQPQEELNPFHQMCERLRTMPKATIAKVAGRVGGGGSELVASCDMRYGALGLARVNQMEVALGILPGGTGTQRLPRLLGRGRAMEVILGSDDLDAATAERWGYFNRAMPPVELDTFVDGLAHRIAAFPAEAIALAKESVNNAELPLEEGLRQEAYLFQKTLRTESAQRNMRQFVARGGQTRLGELRMGALALELTEDP